MCFWIEIKHVIWSILVKNFKLNLISSQDLITKLQEIKGKAEHVKWHMGKQSAESRLGEIIQNKWPGFFKETLRNKIKDGKKCS